MHQFSTIFTLVMQELTNKLQRYLNQRFMLDSDQVTNYCDGGWWMVAVKVVVTRMVKMKMLMTRMVMMTMMLR